MTICERFTVAVASTREFAVPTTSGASRFLGPDDREWTEDGLGTWLTGEVGGLSYSLTPRDRDSHLTLHSRGRGDLAVLSMPGFAGTSEARLTLLPHGTSAALPDNEFHILQRERRAGRPVVVGQIIDDSEPSFLIRRPAPHEVDWSQMPGADEFWTPRSSMAAVDEGVDQHAAAHYGVYCETAGGMPVVRNRGDHRIAVLMTCLGGAFDLVVAFPGESVPIPPGPGIHYVQAARESGRPVVVDVIQVSRPR